MDKCGSKYDEDTVCQRKAGHRGKHWDFGTDDNPQSMTWSDQGLQRELRERQTAAKK
jgi:hypothetical protein